MRRDRAPPGGRRSRIEVERPGDRCPCVEIKHPRGVDGLASACSDLPHLSSAVVFYVNDITVYYVGIIRVGTTFSSTIFHLPRT